MRHAISLEALRILDAIERKGSFGAAAEAIHKVPSALSYTVAKLEADLGVSIFDRSGQRAVLTAAGRLLLEEGRHLLAAAERLEALIKQLESGWEPVLRIARDTILPMAPLLGVLGQFNQLDKQVEISLSDEVLGGSWDALVAERCDLILGAGGELPRGHFEYRSIGEVEFVFAVAAGHPLTGRQAPVDQAAIRDLPTIVVADSSRSLPGRSSGLLDGRHTIRVASMQAKLDAQVMGLGVGFLPKHLAEPALQNGSLIALPCTIPRPNMPAYMAWRKDNKGLALQWFVQACAAVRWFL
ncbi:MAG TPA: LysR substrate-binding domain-containing protein [Cellvibrionaceae bacterium]|nr:LysR substrate-binding domain-containing protein [Cellvibrionaceae bacterium]